MNKTLALLSILIASQAMAAGKKRYAPVPVASPSAAPNPVVTAVPAPSPSPAPSPTGKIITLKCDSTCNAEERANLPLIEAAMNQTLSSKCFADYITKPGRRMDYNNRNTPTQILTKLRTPTALTVNMYWSNGRDQGYEQDPDYSTIHMNRRYTKEWFNCEIASLGGHEFSHTKNFYHMGNKAAPNYYSVPYTVNHAFDPKSDDSYNGGCCVPNDKP